MSNQPSGDIGQKYCNELPQQNIGYGVPHLISCGTRHEAVAQAAIIGRDAPDGAGSVLDWTQRVTHFYTSPPNRRSKITTDGGGGDA